MKRVLGLLLIAVVVVAIAVAGYLTYASGFLASLLATKVQVAEVQPGPIAEYVDERGKTRLPRTHEIAMPFSGRVQQIDLLPGTPVVRGQTLATIDARDVANEVDELKSAVARLDAQIRETADATVEEVAFLQAEQLHQSMSRTVEAADQRKVAGKQRMDFAEKMLGRIAKLVRQDAEVEEELDRAELAHVEGQVNYRQDVLVWQAMQAMEAATGFLPRMVRHYIERKELTTNVLNNQKLEAEARLRQALLKQQRGTMACPIDGVVLERLVESEQYLAAGTPLLRVGTLGELEIEADVLSQDVVRIRAGQEVEVYGPATGREQGKGFAGRVLRVHPGGFTKISSLGVEQQRVRVVIGLLDETLAQLRDENVGVGYRVRVRIITQTEPRALRVPRSALFRGPDGGWQTFAVRDGQAILQAVEVGLMNDRHVQVVSGLEQGEFVVLAPESSLVDQTPVFAK